MIGAAIVAGSRGAGGPGDFEPIVIVEQAADPTRAAAGARQGDGHQVAGAVAGLISGREDLNDVIKRFRLERAEYLKSSRELGYKYGLQGLSDIPLKAIEFLERHSGLPVKSLSDIPYDEINNCIYSMGGLYEVCQGNVGKYEDLEGREIDPDEFLIGFYGGMLELFIKIQDQIYGGNKEANNVD